MRVRPPGIGPGSHREQTITGTARPEGRVVTEVDLTRCIRREGHAPVARVPSRIFELEILAREGGEGDGADEQRIAERPEPDAPAVYVGATEGA
jgi:hypothetical protein